MISIKINGNAYNNVSTLEPEVRTDYAYDVTTLDGKRHRKVEGTKTNYKIVFFNDLSGDFYYLKRLLSESNTVMLTVPVTNTEEETAEYYPQITNYNAKGILNGEFFHNLLAVSFDKVNYDE